METIESPIREKYKSEICSLTLLRVDLIVQSIILCALLISLGAQNNGSSFIICYFILGGYQLTSAIIHFIQEKPSLQRRAYNIQLVIHLSAWAIIGLSAATVLIAPTIFFLLMFELCCTLLTALYYYIITINELNTTKYGNHEFAQ